ncbi:hypothetical protein JCM8547_000729 [Rhodosporidiobolus lusitaniae]
MSSFSYHETSPVKPSVRSASMQPLSSLPRARSTRTSLFTLVGDSMRRSRSTPTGADALDEYDVCSVDLPARSNSVASWFSDDESDGGDARRSWSLATLRKKKSRRSVASSTFSSSRVPPLPTRSSALPSRTSTSSTASSSNFVLPPAQPLDLAIDVDFDGDFTITAARRFSSSTSRSMRQSFDMAARRPRPHGHTSWGSSIARSDAASSRASTDSRIDWADSFSLSSPSLPYSPDMVEVDEEPSPWAPKSAKVDYQETSDLFAFFQSDAPLTSTPFLSSPRPRLRHEPSNDSLMDPMMSSPTFSQPRGSIDSQRAFGLDFPLPPPSATTSPLHSPTKGRLVYVQG